MDSDPNNIRLEEGTYEIIRNRLAKQRDELQGRLEKLNTARMDVFGAIKTELISNARITTEHNCIPRDIIEFNGHCIFGYNVHMGLKSGTALRDVFTIYDYKDHNFQEVSLDLITDPRFEEDFANLYRYYKNTIFSKFAIIGPHLYMAFQIGRTVEDLKVFKWLIQGDQLKYIDDRSAHEFVMPERHEFSWKRAHRGMHREGKHPHISIDDRIFVETIGGDLTIKIEDNTETGQGIYSEPVSIKDQTLDDAEILYADLGNIILLKIKPFQEKKHRYLAFNDKVKEVRRIDAIEDSCVLLPDDHGIIFSNGYYLQTGEFKLFELAFSEMHFERRMPSPNGEDHLFVFYNAEQGLYILLSYNVIRQEVLTPIICHGFCTFDNGELSYFRAEDKPQKHHVVQIWQTPYAGNDFEFPVDTQSRLYKIGNKDIVKAMAESHEVINLLNKEDSYANLYHDLVKKTGDILDAYYWLAEKDTFELNVALQAIRESASSAISEYEKVEQIRKNTREQSDLVSSKAKELLKKVNRGIFDTINQYVEALAELRGVRGEVISLRELRYVNLEMVAEFEKELAGQSDKLSQKCVEFLLGENSLKPYEAKLAEAKGELGKVSKATEADKLFARMEEISGELEMLIEIVSNLKIEDSTQTTRIIDAISAIYSQLNQEKAALRNKRKDLLGTEKIAEFNAQLRLLNQATTNYLDISETPAKCDEYLTKLLVQVEELEGKFVDFEEFITQLSDKREEIYNAFESKKVQLSEARNKRALALESAADRVLNGIRSRAASMKDVNEINAYFASDLMVDKVRNLVDQLVALEDTVKADEIQSRLKTLKEDAVRQLKDKQDLFVEGENVIKLGRHNFFVNTQPLDLTVIPRENEMYYHLTGTNFFEKITDPAFLATREAWNQQMISENQAVYRAEYLAYALFTQLSDQGGLDIDDLLGLPLEGLEDLVRKAMAPRYGEGYTKGVHDHDTALILKALVDIHSRIDLLRFGSKERACAALYWQKFADEKRKINLSHRLKGIGYILQAFPNSKEFGALIADLQAEVKTFIEETKLFKLVSCNEAGEYLFHELSRGDAFVISLEAAEIVREFEAYLKKNKLQKTFEDSLKGITDQPVDSFELVSNWISAFVHQTGTGSDEYIAEAAVLIYTNGLQSGRLVETKISESVSGLRGEHALIKEGNYELRYNEFIRRLGHFTGETAPRYQAFLDLKKRLTDEFRHELRLEEFRPRVMSSFVRNRLIDEVYLPLVGDNLAKQIGVAGEAKRTDLMGLLLLISPPGYGKTTLMEYLANRLGLIFMKINGPAIGHRVTSLDPGEAPNLSARQELNKLNLALEMGNNVMLYLDDIQHCNPEFLQKFISLCDAQRKIEGVYKGRSRTYDLRGKKVAVVMAGNPYTESGDKFQVPDMLANRADTYNLGDIIGDTEEAFKLSYIENCLTSNPILQKLATKSRKDIHSFIRLARTGDREGLEFEAGYSPEEINEFVSVLGKLLQVRDIILKVNLQYIASAAQADEYRTEPPFQLQGSYRDMGKLAEKIVPIMNDAELKTLVLSHYENESQTLTSGAEANLLKFKELIGWATPEDTARWTNIKKTFVKNNAVKGLGGDRMGQAIAQLGAFGQSLESIKEALEKGLGKG
ncbi:MAG: DNA repair ATPase [Bacteroidia bacterium]|nr:DNA repair ATPase [Bacteroidia bacterium]